MRSLNSFMTIAWIALILSSSQATQAQQPPAAPGADKPDLTEGLLDLLKEPATSTPAKTPDASQSSQPDADKSKDDVAQPASDAGTSNRKSAETNSANTTSAAHPLAEVHQGMKTLAELMRSKPDAQRARQLQRDVVTRLDEMIGQLEQQAASSQSNQPSNSAADNAANSTQSQQNQTSNSSSSKPDGSANAGQGGRQGTRQSGAEGTRADSSQRPGNGQESGKAANQANANNRASEGQPGNEGSQSQPSQPGLSAMRPRNVTVDLNDPRALQRSAWGQLPERMREQMQSRMVERFLPSYRDEIEAYYRELVK